MSLFVLVVMHEVLDELQYRHEILSARTRQEKTRMSEDKAGDLRPLFPTTERTECAMDSNEQAEGTRLRLKHSRLGWTYSP